MITTHLSRGLFVPPNGLDDEITNEQIFTAWHHDTNRSEANCHFHCENFSLFLLFLSPFDDLSESRYWMATKSDFSAKLWSLSMEIHFYLCQPPFHCALFCVDSLISLLGYRKKHTTNFNRSRGEKKKFVKSKKKLEFFFNSCFKNTKIPFVSFAGLCFAVCCVGASRLFHKTEWNKKKKTLNTTRGYERYKNRFFVYLFVDIFVLCFKLSLYTFLLSQKLHKLCTFHAISIQSLLFFDNDTEKWFTIHTRDSNKRLSSLSFFRAFHTCWWFLSEFYFFFIFHTLVHFLVMQGLIHFVYRTTKGCRLRWHN